MKKIFYILASFALILSGCENDPDIYTFPDPDIAFSYKVEGDQYVNDYYIGSSIRFTDQSVKKGNITWEFGDGSTSTDVNPVHVYDMPGIYEVVLKIEGEGSTKNKLFISDVMPIVKYSALPLGDVEYKKSLITTDTELPNLAGYPETYEWVYPEGTTTEDGTPISTSREKNPPSLRFSNVGSQQVILKTTFNGRQLDDKTVNIHVGTDTPVKTIYYAEKEGNLKAYKLSYTLPAGVKNTPLNLGVSSGQHPFNILFSNKDSLLYVLDAGKQFYFIDDITKTLGDGKITVVARDGKNVESMMNNVGKYAFDDPFYGYIDETSRSIYFTDRNTGISKLSLDDRNKGGERSWFVKNDLLTYYGQGIAYGAGNGNFTKLGDTWWWGKYFTSVGIFRFKDADILATPAPTGTPTPSSGVLLSNVANVKSFVVDQNRGFVYLAVSAPADMAGFYKVPLSEIGNITVASALKPKMVLALPRDKEGTDAEPVYITQMVLDSEDGSVYFGYRAGEGTSEKSGLKRFNYDTGKVETLLENVQIYGITISNNKSKLF